MSKLEEIDAALATEQARVDKSIAEAVAAHDSVGDNYWHTLERLREQRRVAIAVQMLA